MVQIKWNDIYPIWQNYLWKNRPSPIETHSAITWPPTDTYDISIFDYEPTFWGVYHRSILIGVNSGHKTSASHYRSRGLWIDCTFRGQRLSTVLLNAAIRQAEEEGCELIWSIPRLSALRAYESVGFEAYGDTIKTQTCDENTYAFKSLV